MPPPRYLPPCLLRHLPAVVLAVVLTAADAPPLGAEEPADGWTGDVELSFVNVGGNSDSNTLSVGAKAELKLSNSRLKGEAKTLYGEQNGVSTTRSYFLKGQYDLNVTQRTSIFVSASVERDTPKGLEIRDTVQVGVGHLFIDSAPHTLRGEASTGYVYERLTIWLTNPAPPPLLLPMTVVNGYPAARLAADYTYAFSETSRFQQTAEMFLDLTDAGDFLINEESALITNLAGQLALKASFTVNYDHEPPQGSTAVDRIFKTSLLYTF